MNKFIKLFPFMPAPKNGGKLALAILFYILVPSIINGVVVGVSIVLAGLMGYTIVLLPLALIVIAVEAIICALLSAYTVLGLVFAILSFSGRDLGAPQKTSKTEN